MTRSYVIHPSADVAYPIQSQIQVPVLSEQGPNNTLILFTGLSLQLLCLWLLIYVIRLKQKHPLLGWLNYLTVSILLAIAFIGVETSTLLIINQ